MLHHHYIELCKPGQSGRVRGGCRRTGAGGGGGGGTPIAESQGGWALRHSGRNTDPDATLTPVQITLSPRRTHQLAERPTINCYGYISTYAGNIHIAQHHWPGLPSRYGNGNDPCPESGRRRSSGSRYRHLLLQVEEAVRVRSSFLHRTCISGWKIQSHLSSPV